MKNLCLICRSPHNIWCEFLNNFKKYKITVIIDDNKKSYNSFKEDYSNINFIQIPDSDCIEKKYTNLNFFMKKNVTGWEKAIYYFTFIDNDKEDVWFIEDDVFFYDENTINNIDIQYNDSDLLTNMYDMIVNFDMIENINNQKYNIWKNVID